MAAQQFTRLNDIGRLQTGRAVAGFREEPYGHSDSAVGAFRGRYIRHDWYRGVQKLLILFCKADSASQWNAQRPAVSQARQDRASGIRKGFEKLLSFATVVPKSLLRVNAVAQ